MVPPPVTEDYYLILEVEHTATRQSIVSSYRRLALKLHPDRNDKYDATEAFQRLGRAYETLNDENKRRAYDLTYPSIRRQSRPDTQIPRPTRTSSASQTGIPSEAAQIAAIKKSKRERGERWRVKKNIFDSAIFNLQRRIRPLQQAIKNLESIAAAEAAEDARKNSWSTWLSSPMYRKMEESQEEKERKSIERQERRIEKDMKERRMESLNAEVKVQERLFKQAREEVEAADECDDQKIRVLEAKISARETLERRERERQERERLAREWKERERQRVERERQQMQEREKLEKERERQRQRVEKERQEKERQKREKLEKERLEREREKLEKERQEKERQERERQRLERERVRQLIEKQARQRQQNMADLLKRQQQQQQQQAGNLQNQQRQNRGKQAQNHRYAWSYTPAQPPHTAACEHHGWWPKVEGLTNCPNCDETWRYLLECPSCEMKRCPKCQAAIRRARQNRRGHPQRVRTPSPDFDYW